MSATGADVEPGDLRPDGTPADAPPGWDGEALGTATDIASAPPPDERRVRRFTRWQLLHQARDLLRARARRTGGADSYRVLRCQYSLARDPFGKPALGVRVYCTEHRAWFSNVMRCGSVWTCPVCAAAAAAKRRRYLRELEYQAAQQGLGVALVTLTTPHHAGDDLDDLVARLSDARRRMRTGRAWQRFKARWGWIGEARTLEVTHGRLNGWHPHYHSMVFVEAMPRRARDRARFERELHALWAGACTAAGLGEPTPEHGTDVAWGSKKHAGYGSRVAEYVAKWGFAGEVTGAQVKGRGTGGRTPWELLAAAREGDEHAGWLWCLYADAFDGRHQLQVSPGLKARLQPRDLEELPDADPEHEALEHDERPSEAGWIEADDWAAVCRLGAHEAVLAAAMEGREALEGELADIRRRAGRQRDGPDAMSVGGLSWA